MNEAEASLTRGYSVALLSAVILSTTAIFIRYLTEHYGMPPLVLALWRAGLVSLSLLAVLRLLRPDLLRAERHHLFYLLVYGFVLALFNAVWTLSVALNGAAIATVLAYMSVAFTALFGWWFLDERLGWAKILVVSLALAGTVLVTGALDPAAWKLNLLGMLTGALSGLSYAVYSLMGRSAAQRGLNPWTTLLYTFGFGTVFLLLFNLLPGEYVPGTATVPADFFWLGTTVSGWLILLLLAAGPTVLGYGLYNVSLSLLPSSVANLIVTLEPVFTIIIAYLLLGERLTPVQIAGSALIITGVLFLRVYEGRQVRMNQRASSDEAARPPCSPELR